VKNRAASCGETSTVRKPVYFYDSLAYPAAPMGGRSASPRQATGNALAVAVQAVVIYASAGMVWIGPVFSKNWIVEASQCMQLIKINRHINF
jgi:hypothetical protein